MSDQTTLTGTTSRETDREDSRNEEAWGNGLLIYFLLGVYLGIVFTKSEVVSWFRIQEMFRFQSFHMYGIIGSALAVASISVAMIKRYDLGNISGEPIVIPPKKTGSRNWRYWIGGTLFGVGWALTGACPGPIFALIGNGIWVMTVVLLSAVAGTWVYGYMRPNLPHY
jgi:uncharacterized membrane protein YedE/YeeE